MDSQNIRKSKKKQKQNSGRIAKECYDKENRRYFGSIKNPPILYVEVRKFVDPYAYLDLRNSIVLLMFEAFQLHEWVCVRFVQSGTCENHSTGPLIRFKCSVPPQQYHTNLQSPNCSNSCNFDEIDDYENFKSASRKHPSVTVVDKKMIICGISSVLRFLFKFVCCVIEIDDTLRNPLEEEILAKFKQFLGFRGGCLQACAESSIWTKFCEVDMPETVNQMQINFGDVSISNTKVLSENLLRFEYHLSLPVKIHNFRKIIQGIRKSEQSAETSGSNNLTDQTGNEVITDLKHDFAEGPTLLLSDLILYPSVHVSVLLLGRGNFEKYLPKTLEWYDKVHQHFQGICFDLSYPDCCNALSTVNSEELTVPNVPVQSLYSRDTSRYKPSLRQFTRQYDIDEVLGFLKQEDITPLEVGQEEPTFDWTKIPVLAHPEGGSLPHTRLQRKCDQLASLAYYAMNVYKEKSQQRDFKCKRFRIVDFCSGGGHLGILVAWLLPECEVVLVENKDESLRRAQERVSGLGLPNVICYQSNLDYFGDTFDLGMALHACGTATDLVLAKCINVNASFVCCPCCYGAIQENHVLDYPRSTNFKQAKLPLRYYFILSHASDQTHDSENEKTEQGKRCMSYVDSDRCLLAAESGYEVKLCKIVPETASPKNHILVGISPLGHGEN